MEFWKLIVFFSHWPWHSPSTNLPRTKLAPNGNINCDLVEHSFALHFRMILSAVFLSTPQVHNPRQSGHWAGSGWPKGFRPGCNQKYWVVIIVMPELCLCFLHSRQRRSEWGLSCSSSHKDTPSSFFPNRNLLCVRAIKKGVENTGMNANKENIRICENRPLKGVTTSPLNTTKNLHSSKFAQLFTTVFNRDNSTC